MYFFELVFLFASDIYPGVELLDQVKTVTGFIFLGFKITVDGVCSHEIKGHLLLGRKAMTDLESMLKSRDIKANKGPYSQIYGFSSSHVWL